VQSYRHSILALLLCVAAAAPAAAQPAATATAPAASDPLAPPLERLRRGNGLRVVMDRRSDTSIVSVCSVWGVGSRDETGDEVGYARLVEQLARRVDEVELRVTERGGTTWSTTEVDRTIFCTTVPQSELPIAVWAEASRLQPLRTPAVLFERDRDRAIARLLPPGVEAPRERGRQLLWSLAFQGWWRPERTPETSLLDLTVQDLDAIGRFHQRYYRSDNVVFSFSGNVDAAEVRAQLDAQVDGARPRGAIPSYTPPDPPPRQTSERFAGLEDDGLGTPLVMFAYAIPGPNSADHRALELAAAVLGGGPASTLHEQLVVRQRQARSVRAWTSQHRGAGALVVEISFTKAATMKHVELVLDQQLRRLRVAGPTQQELARARALLTSDLLDRVQTSQQRARLFGEWELMAGDAGLVSREPAAYAAITPGQVRQACKDHVDSTVPSIVEVHPPGWYTPGDAKPPPRVHIVDRGETLIGIAKRYGITVNQLISENKIQRNKPIFPGQTLKLPKGAKDSGPRKRGTSSRKAPAAKPKEHVVARGQTLSGIAHRHGVTTTALARANGLDPKRPIRVGQKLVVPPKPAPARKDAKDSSTESRRAAQPASKRAADQKPDEKATESPRPVRTHVVQKGQTLSGIARANGVSTAELARFNGIDPKKPIRIGQKLKIPPPQPKR
jgi:zinc protease